MSKIYYLVNLSVCMDAKISDTTGDTISKDSCYQVTVKSLGNSTNIQFDSEWNEQIKSLISLAMQHGQKWYVWKKNQENDRLEKIYEGVSNDIPN